MTSTTLRTARREGAAGLLVGIACLGLAACGQTSSRTAALRATVSPAAAARPATPAPTPTPTPTPTPSPSATVRQKLQDILTQLAVSVQGYLAMDLVRRNNLELIKGVDRATTTTVSALRTAVVVAQALVNQRLVLSQVTALNETAGTLIEATSEMLRGQTAEIHTRVAAPRSASRSSRRPSPTCTRRSTRSTATRGLRSRACGRPSRC